MGKAVSYGRSRTMAEQGSEGVVGLPGTSPKSCHKCPSLWDFILHFLKLQTLPKSPHPLGF